MDSLTNHELCELLNSIPCRDQERKDERQKVWKEVAKRGKEMMSDVGRK